jgi:hypothetical protein
MVRLAELARVSQGLSTSGRAAGARPGDWKLSVVSVGSIQDDRLLLDQADAIRVEQNAKTEKHLLRPEDVLVTARSTLYKAALVPPQVSRTVADATLLVVRPREPGLSPYLWWYLTSAIGRERAQARMTGSTVLALSAGSLGDLEMPLPPSRVVDQIAELIDASERAYAAAIEAARLRRTVFRDAMIEQLSQVPEPDASGVAEGKETRSRFDEFIEQLARGM